MHHGVHTQAVAIVYRLSKIKESDKILVLVNEETDDSGTHEQLIEKDRMYAALVRSQELVQKQIKRIIKNITIYKFICKTHGYAFFSIFLIFHSNLFFDFFLKFVYLEFTYLIVSFTQIRTMTVCLND